MPTTFEVACETCNDLVDILAGRVDGMYRGIMASTWLYNALLGTGVLVGLVFIWWLIREARGRNSKPCRVCPVSPKSTVRKGNV